MWTPAQMRMQLIRFGRSSRHPLGILPISSPCDSPAACLCLTLMTQQIALIRVEHCKVAHCCVRMQSKRAMMKWCDHSLRLARQNMRLATASPVHGFGSARAAETVKTADIVICVQKLNSNEGKRRKSRQFGNKSTPASCIKRQRTSCQMIWLFQVVKQRIDNIWLTYGTTSPLKLDESF